MLTQRRLLPQSNHKITVIILFAPQLSSASACNASTEKATCQVRGFERRLTFGDQRPALAYQSARLASRSVQPESHDGMSPSSRIPIPRAQANERTGQLARSRPIWRNPARVAWLGIVISTPERESRAARGERRARVNGQASVCSGVLE